MIIVRNQASGTPVTAKRLFHSFLFLLFQVASGGIALAQPTTITGVVNDNRSLSPVGNVSIMIQGTREGVYSESDGHFSIRVKRFPVTLVLSCVGYETLFFDIFKAPLKPLGLVMKQRISELKEVNVTASRYEFVFRDDNYSVKDYEILGNNILLMVYRYRLNSTELILVDCNGDTLAVTPVPEQKPVRLYRDFLSNVHYISNKGNAFQCDFNDLSGKLEFPFQTTYDTLIRMVKPFLFTVGGRTFFEENSPDGYGKTIGYVDADRRIGYIRDFSGEPKWSHYYDDLGFDRRWNGFTEGSARFSADDRRAMNLFYYQKTNAPLVKLGNDSIALFNFTDGVIEVMDGRGNLCRKVPIDFHREQDKTLMAGLVNVLVPISDWSWCGQLYVDEYYREVYTAFRKNGMFRVRKIDLATGKLTRSCDIPFPFPVKLTIHKGNAYFLSKASRGEYEKWKLLRVTL